MDDDGATGQKGFWGSEQPEIPGVSRKPRRLARGSEEPLISGVSRPKFDPRHPFRRTVIDAEGNERTKASKLELPILVAVAIAIAVILKTFVLQPFYIPSPSMEKTLHGCDGCPGDRILVFKPIYHLRDPHPGDIVVFKAPEAWNEGGGVPKATNPVTRSVQWFGQLVGVVPPSEKDLVKRVIAIGGQSIKC